jgi:hypothetical protein
MTFTDIIDKKFRFAVLADMNNFPNFVLLDERVELEDFEDNSFLRYDIIIVKEREAFERDMKLIKENKLKSNLVLHRIDSNGRMHIL